MAEPPDLAALSTLYVRDKPTATVRELAEARIRTRAIPDEAALLAADIADATQNRDRAHRDAIAAWRAEFRENKVKVLRDYDALLQEIGRVHARLAMIEEAENQKCGAVERVSWHEFDASTPMAWSRVHAWRDYLRQAGLLA